MLNLKAKPCCQGRAMVTVVATAAMSVLQFPRCDLGWPRRRGGMPWRQKRKATLGVVVGCCCCCWFYKIMLLLPEGDRGTPGVESPGPVRSTTILCWHSRDHKQGNLSPPTDICSHLSRCVQLNLNRSIIPASISTRDRPRFKALPVI